jgi:hypothetical protein
VAQIGGEASQAALALDPRPDPAHRSLPGLVDHPLGTFGAGDGAAA